MNREKKHLSHFQKEALSWAKTIAIALVLVFIVNTFFVVNAEIPSSSMENTLMVHDRLFALRTAYLTKDPERLDIVVFRLPDDESELYIKRIIGLPGETVKGKDGVVYVNDQPLTEPYCKEPIDSDFGPFTVPEDCYFMMGDNRRDSYDSRYWKNHFVTQEQLVGKAALKYYPSFQLF